mgnify:CR=1 FL=1
MATDTSSTGRDSDKFMLRLPDGMRDQLKQAAALNNRTLNAEVVARLQLSMGTESQEDVSTPHLEGQIEQFRSLANSFRSVADIGDTVRVSLSAMLARALELSPEAAREALGDEGIVESIASFLQSKDPRGAVFSLVELLDGSSPEVVEHLRNFASHVEDLELHRKPIKLTVRGKQVDGPMTTRGDALSPLVSREGASVNKVILVGTIGRDPVLRSLHGERTGTARAPGDNSPPGPKKSANARQPAVKKSPK